MRKPHTAAPDVFTLPSHLPIDGVGMQPVNTHLVRGSQPLLIDSGMPVDRGDFEAALWSLVEPTDLRWIVLTHDDRDHAGNLREVLMAAPHATLLTNGLSIPRLAEQWEVPRHRVRTINPGRRLELGDRTISVLRPPAYDAPSTLAIYDHTSRSLFSSDCFGTVLPTLVEDAADAAESDYLDGMRLFTRANAPWTALVDQHKFNRAITEIERLRPDRVLSSHAPTATGRTDVLLELMRAIPAMAPWLPDEDLSVEAVLGRHDVATAI
ncbi:MAG: MBL fold metallo-hydrolase [Pseudonocardiaceae bacterium]